VITSFALWWLVSQDGLKLVSQDSFPSPTAVVGAAGRVRSVIGEDIVATLARVLVGMAAGTALGIGVGLLMSYDRRVLYSLEPLVESMRPVPVIAMIPFFLLWFGISENGKLLLISLGVFTVVVVNTLEAVRNVPPIYIRAAKTLGARRRQIYRRIILPGIVPGLVGPLRVALAVAFTLSVAAEFLGADRGVGYRILEARRLYRPDVILLGVLLFGVMAGIVDLALRRGLRYLTRWSERETTRKEV
jgi:ABC-type nitrate/sulfonate/bicarbonate transport system permease component